MSEIVNKKTLADGMRSFDKLKKLVSKREKMYLQKEELEKKIKELEGNTTTAAYSVKQNLLDILQNLKPDSGPYLSLAETEDGNEDFYASNTAVNALKLNIEQNFHKFVSQPVGPLYQLFTIVNPEYLALMEYVLKEELFTFIVKDKNDKKLLKRLIADQYGDPKIPQSETQRRIRRPKVVHLKSPAPYQLLKSALRWGNPVFNDLSLIPFLSLMEFTTSQENEDLAVAHLQQKISAGNILLFSNDFRAYNILGDYYRYLEGCVAYTLDGFRMFALPYFKRDCIGSYGVAKYLRVDNAKQIEALKSSLSLHEIRLLDLNYRIQKLRMKLATAL